MQSGLFKSIALIFLLTVTLSPSYGNDFTRFLARQDFTIAIDADGMAKVHPSSYGYVNGSGARLIGENYTAIDHFGNVYVLSLGPVKRLYSEVSVSILATAIGLTGNPNFPLFVRRGEHGLPMQTVASSAFNHVNSKFEFAPDDAFIPATMRPHFDLDPVDWIKVASAPEKVAALVMHMSMNFLFATKIWEAYPKHDNTVFQNFGYIARRNCFVMLNLEDAFSETRYRSGKIASYFGEFPRRLINKMSVEAQIRFYKELNLFLTRLEHIDSKDVRLIVEAGFAKFDSGGKVIDDALVDVFQERVKFLRFEIYMMLASWHRSSDRFPGELLKTPLKLASLPHVYLPSQNNRGRDPFQDLWNYFFSYSDKWVPSVSDEIIAARIGDAKETQSHFGVWSQTDPLVGDGAEFKERRSLQLNAHNGATVVLHSSNDKEANGIFALSTEAGAQVYNLKLSHGESLKDDDMAKFVAWLGKVNIDRIFAIELPSFAAAWNKVSHRFNAVDVRHIDHHEYRGDGAHYHRFASIEQLSQALGASLTLSEQLTAWMDRDGVYGLAKSRFNQIAMIDRYSGARARILKEAILKSSWHPEQTAIDDVHVHYLPDMPVSLFEYGMAISAAYAARAHREPLTSFSKDIVIMTRSFMPSILYAGPANIVAHLDHAFEDLDLLNDFRYGNLSEHPVRSVYFKTREDFERSLQKIFATLRGKPSLQHDFQVKDVERAYAFRIFIQKFLRFLANEDLRSHEEAIGQILLSMSRELGATRSHKDLDDLRSFHIPVVQMLTRSPGELTHLAHRMFKPALRRMKKDTMLQESYDRSMAMIHQLAAEGCSLSFEP